MLYVYFCYKLCIPVNICLVCDHILTEHFLLFLLKNGDIYFCQEEDLFTMTYDLPLNGDGDERCLSMLNAVEETISRQLRACKVSSSKRRVPDSEGNCFLKLEHFFFFRFIGVVSLL